MSPKAILAVDNLHVRYGRTEVVHGVSFSLTQGAIVGIIGESGSGKSTIAKVLMKLHPAASGSITYPAINPAPRLAMIFQDATGSLNPRRTIGQMLKEVLMVHSARTPRTQALKRVRTISEILSLVGLSEAVLKQYPRELSGGQCQRISIARALATNPDILIADEPVSALDVSVQARILNLLRDLRRELGLSIIFIAHDLAVVKNLCDYVHIMEKGIFVESGPSEQVFSTPKAAYTRILLAACPR